MARREDNAKATLGAIILVGGALMFFLFFFGVIPKLFQGDMREVRVNFASTGSLHKGDPVRIDGVNVGTVKDYEAHEGGDGVTVTLQLEDEAGTIYNDARAQVRWRTLLGANFALALDRGTPRAGELPDGGLIPASRTDHQVELEEIGSALRADAQSGMRKMFEELPKTLDDPDQPGEFLDEVAKASPGIAKGFDALRGIRRDRDLRELVGYTGEAMAALNAPHDALRGLVQGAGLTFQTTANRYREIQQLMELGGGIQPRVRGTLANLNRTLDRANPLLAKLMDPADDVEPALAALQPVVSDADRLLTRKVLPLVRDLRPTAASLARTARNGVPLLDQLAPSLQRIDEHILPDLAVRSPETGRTTYEMIGPTMAAYNGLSSHSDDESKVIRFDTSLGAHLLLDNPCKMMLNDPGATALVSCQELARSLGRVLGLPGSAQQRSTAGGKP